PRAGSRRDEIRRVLLALAVMPLFYWPVLEWELPALAPIWLAPRVVALAPPGPIGAVGFSEPSLMFLAGTQTRWLLASQAVPALAQGEVGSLLVTGGEKAAIQQAAIRAGLQLRIAGQVDGFNYSRGRSVTLWLLTPTLGGT
ncbi:MAG TPA: hypothetical protein VE650_05235, partial [Acetobacteraceae bacterium]|nr:hypothetical protein [Acetobacteraceae bacterium]